MKYKGSCHCGKIAFEVEGEIDSGLTCNCSICQRKGSLLWFAAREQLRLLTPPENLKTYTFNKHRIKHQFCAECGMHPFAEGVAPDGKATVAINLRCLEDFDINSVPTHHYDGRSA